MLKLKENLIRAAMAAMMICVVSGTAQAGPKTIRIAAMGDIMLGTENLLPADEAAGTFTDVKSYLEKCQVVIGNLEGPLTDQGAPTKESVEGVSYVFRTPPAYVERLSEAGFTVMSMANNHANDYGPDGYRQTREVLEKAGLLHTGAPGQVARQKVGRTTVSVIGLAPNSGCQDLNDIDSAAELVRQEAAEEQTLVVVVFHGGAEGASQISVPDGPEYYLGEKRGDLRRLARTLIDAGAHLVIGHGPHVPRGLELYQGRLIAYSLGNFATGRGINVSGRGGLAPLLLVELTPKGELVTGQIVSFKQEEAGRPRLDPDGGAAILMHSIGLADFEFPALDVDGAIMITETAAKTMAAAYPRPKAVAVAEAKSVPIPEVQAVAEPAPEPAKRRGQSGRTPKTTAKYEWDVYSGNLN